MKVYFWNIGCGDHRPHTRQCLGLGRINREYLGVGVGTAEELAYQ